ncbi:MAG TPA: AraC family transcriptional regulator [Niabella sp.]|nr:AraC family transcriptional regulator [Niabella sp.]HQW14103.1 AraC family transcriptional regulator [Niabella sp.]HQX19354.1 AraC family transcriptional regulator [Niabella sp.]HQX41788.1 AraC family transcriptional regulator [Niabella sp.]HRB05571.1 AraC family transcriptional regulator [Niabella sp.]
MKVLEFTLPIVAHNFIITKEEKQLLFYPHLHRHNEIQLKWIIEGEGTLVAGNSLHHFRNNEIFWIGARQAHVFKSNQSTGKNKSKNKIHSIDIFFNMETQLAPFFSLPEMERLKAFVHKHQNGFKVPSESVSALSAIILQLKNSKTLDRVLNFILLFKLLLSLKHLEPLTTSAEIVQVDERDGLRIASIYNFILKNYKEQISLEEVAKLAFMTPQAFCRYFKKHTHNTLVGFVNQVRINEACKQLMENNNDTIATIAYNTGFNSITNFNRVFKSVVKKSPKEYVASYLKQVD